MKKTDVIIKPVTATTQVELKTQAKAEETTRSEIVDMEAISGPMMLDVELGLTKALKKFESARITVRLTRPTTSTTLDSDYESSRRWIEDKIKKEVESINESMNQMTADNSNFDY